MMTHEDKLRLLTIAVNLSEVSRDPLTRNAALLVSNEGDIVYTRAVNNFPVGVVEYDERWERPMKYDYVQHAERGAIYAAAKLGFKTGGTTLICPFFACQECAKAIVGAGISNVIGLYDPTSHWRDKISIGDVILLEAGVKIERLKDKLGLHMLRDGKLLEV